jgi:RNA polymerase sigma-70 factor (ECF subfamily)
MTVKFKEFQHLKDEEILAESYKNPVLFEVLVDRHQVAFLRKARKIVRTDEAATDVVQDTFVKIYMYGKKFRPVEGAQFTSWAYRILINTCYAWYKKAKKDREFTTAFDEDLEAVIPDESHVVAGREASDTDYVMSLVERLPDTFSSVLRLYVLEGKNYREIAEREGVTEGAIKTRVHRAKEMLRDLSKTITY